MIIGGLMFPLLARSIFGTADKLIPACRRIAGHRWIMQFFALIRFIPHADSSTAEPILGTRRLSIRRSAVVNQPTLSAPKSTLLPLQRIGERK
jgi:hypothetical protein